VYKLFNLVPFAWNNFGWAAILHQTPTILALCIVCAFGTSMDIMAVQAELPREIDADWEISTVGMSNIAAGLFTGGGPGAFRCGMHLYGLYSYNRK
jgi:MFS superfamily sulfate permease-like transporter